MKGKKKRNQQSKVDGMSSSSGSDLSDSQGNVARRVSDRIKRKIADVPSSNTRVLIDSAYDGDNDSATAESSPEQELNDPYAIEMLEDVPKVPKKSQKKMKKTECPPKQFDKKKLPHSPVPTSTPLSDIQNLKNKRRSINRSSVSVTPELTPILPTHVEELQSASFSTPYNRRSTRKRTLQTDTDTPLLPMNLSYSSHCDSGIGLSPLPKKQLIEKTTKDNASKKQKKKQNHVSIAAKQRSSENRPLTKDSFQPVKEKKGLTVKSVSALSNDSGISSSSNKCFGFDSISPSTPPSSRKAKSYKMSSRPMFSPNKINNYRLAKELALSDSPGQKSDSQVSKDSLDTHGSPSMFSDDMFSTEDFMEVNRSSLQSYKVSKIPKIKRMAQKRKPTKDDEWASNFNMEIADIEKFDLNIE